MRVLSGVYSPSSLWRSRCASLPRYPSFPSPSFPSFLTPSTPPLAHVFSVQDCHRRARPILHRDIKPANVLLDQVFPPLLSLPPTVRHLYPARDLTSPCLSLTLFACRIATSNSPISALRRSSTTNAVRASVLPASPIVR